jgi:hypothetical protein
MKKKSEQQINWLNSEIKKDNLELDREKKHLIDQIKKIKKEEIITKKTEKLSLWKRIMKVVMG